jgi:hypothetical protein
MDLEGYRGSAETFISELTAEYYRHYAGFKDDYEIEPIYKRHAGLFTAGAVAELRAHLDRAASGGEQKRRLRLLLDFAVEGYMGQATKQTEAELARREASITIEVAGEQLGFRQSVVLQANEPAADRRAEIEQGRLLATDEQLNPLYRELIERQHAIAQELGYASYRDLCAQCKALDLPALHAQTAAFSAHTASSYGSVLEPELRRTLGIGIDQLRRSDLSRFDRAPELDLEFPAAELVRSFVETMHGLGIDVGTQPGVVLDVDPRPNKSPRAFCAPVRVPEEVYLVIAPVGGQDDFSALFHEGGHTEHYANVDPALSFEFRHLGDNAITEAFAFLFMHLVENPEWLERRLGIKDSSQVAAHARAQRLIYLRRYAAKLEYELELHGSDGPLSGLAARYSELLGSALQIQWPTETFLADVDPGFYCTCYLRAWALETHLRRYLRERFGPAWFDSHAAGETLLALWREGQRLTPDELLAQLTGERLDFGVLISDLGL